MIFPPVASRVRYGAVVALIHLGIGVYTLGVVYLFASDRLLLSQAATMLGAPLVAILALLRPEWTILLVVALPPWVLIPINPIQMVALLIVALFGFFLQGRLQLDPKTGIYPLVGIILLAVAVKADVQIDAGSVADTTLKYLVYYSLLMLVAYNSVVNGKLRISTFVNALLLGIVATTILQPFFSGVPFSAINQTPFRGQFAYLATMAFGVAYVRLAHSASTKQNTIRRDRILVVVFAVLTAVGFGRASWIAALSVLALVSLWTGKKSFWIASFLLVILILTVPAVEERIFAIGSDAPSGERLSQVTTGRSELWGELFEHGRDALPWGQGWGYTWSLSSTDLFGFAGQYGAEEDGYVFPHNDFLFLFVELGLPGIGLFIWFWLSLISRTMRVSRVGDRLGTDARILAPVLVVGLLVQLFDNGFAIRFVGERFFMTAGVVYGLAYLRARQQDHADSVFLHTNRGYSELGH